MVLVPCEAQTLKTRNHTGSAAEMCRLRGWTVGTRLVGDEGHGPTVIELAAIGDRRLRAKALGHNGVAYKPRESTWELWGRDWRVADDDEIPMPLSIGQRGRSPNRKLNGVVLDGPDGFGFYRLDCGKNGVWFTQAIAESL